MSDDGYSWGNAETAPDQGVVSSSLLDCPDCAELLKLRQPNGVRFRQLPYWYQYDEGCPSCGASNDHEYGAIKIKGNPTGLESATGTIWLSFPFLKTWDGGLY